MMFGVESLVFLCESFLVLQKILGFAKNLEFLQLVE